MNVSFSNSKLLSHLEARTLLYPLLRFDDAVAIQVGTEVAMPTDAHLALKSLQQLRHQQMHGTALLRRARILRTPVRVQSALIADAYRVSIVPFGVRTHHFQRTRVQHRSVSVDVIMIANSAKSATPVCSLQILHRQTAVFASGGTMNNDMINSSHDEL